MSTQLSFDHLDIKKSPTLDDFAMPSFLPVVQVAYDLIMGNLDELYVFGESNSGKSHLLSAILHTYTDRYASTNKIPMFLSTHELLGADPQLLMGLEHFPLLLIDDIHLLVEYPDWQEAILSLLRRTQHHQHQLIVTANQPVWSLNFANQELNTRLSQAVALPMPNNDEPHERFAIIEQLLKQRGLKLPHELIEQLVMTAPHQIGELLTILNDITSQLTQRRGKLSKKALDDLKISIIYQSFMAEFADMDTSLHEQHHPTPYDDGTLPLPLSL